jgi:hypothetical protein
MPNFVSFGIDVGIFMVIAYQGTNEQVPTSSDVVRTKMSRRVPQTPFDYTEAFLRSRTKAHSNESISMSGL